MSSVRLGMTVSEVETALTLERGSLKLEKSQGGAIYEAEINHSTIGSLLVPVEVVTLFFDNSSRVTGASYEVVRFADEEGGGRISLRQR